MAATMVLIWGNHETKYFWRKDWTTQISLIGLKFLAFWRMLEAGKLAWIFSFPSPLAGEGREGGEPNGGVRGYPPLQLSPARGERAHRAGGHGFRFQ